MQAGLIFKLKFKQTKADTTLNCQFFITFDKILHEIFLNLSPQN
jgi:hypothetical protein